MHLLFDIGASNMRLGLSDGKKLIRYVSAPTPTKFKAGIAALAEMAITLNSPVKIKSAIGGICGPLDKPQATMRDSFLKDWVGKPIRDEIRKICKAPVVLTNDARLAGLGEANFGAGKGHKVVAYLTFSSGFGGTRVIDGKSDAKDGSYEPDTQVVMANGKLTPIDPFVSGLTLEKKYKSKLKDLKNPSAWKEIEKWMTVAINNTAVYWAPDIIVLGGSISHNQNVSIARIQKFLNSNLYNENPPRIVKSKLKDLNGLYGAMTLI
jgi:predicted NBD/HSP70 family sugar kinase